MRRLVGAMGILAIALFPQCVEIIDFDLSDVEAEVVIYGVLTDNVEATHWISVTYSRGFGDRIEGISTADVAVVDEAGSVMPYQYIPERQRFEAIDSTFHAVPGIDYSLEVTVDNRTYKSRSEAMPAANVPEQLEFSFTTRTINSSLGIPVDQNIFEVIIEGDATNFTDHVFLKWEVEEVFIIEEVGLIASVFPFYSPQNCYIPRVYPTDELAIFSSIDSKKYRKQLISEPIDEEFKGFHAFGIFQYAISAEAHKFWSDIQKATDRTPTIFEIPPGPVRGNLFNIEDDRDQALGYFMVAKVDTSAVGTTESDIPFFVPGDTPPGGCDVAIALQTLVPPLCMQCLIDAGVPEACVNCVTLEGSTRNRPAYLDDVDFPEDGP